MQSQGDPVSVVGLNPNGGGLTPPQSRLSSFSFLSFSLMYSQVLSRKKSAKEVECHPDKQGHDCTVATNADIHIHIYIHTYIHTYVHTYIHT